MKLTVEFDENVPRYSCEGCYNCTSKIGTSLCEIKNRGCCYYYPKFNLVDIQRMAKSPAGKKVLNKILENKSTVVNNYYIHAIGYFDKEGYEDYVSNMLDESSWDHSIHFKACPFVEPGKGCSIPPKYRTPICNFFICKEIKESTSSQKNIESYERAAQNYWRYYDWENNNLTLALKEHNLSLKKDFNESLEFLANIESYDYEFPSLPECELDIILTLV